MFRKFLEDGKLVVVYDDNGTNRSNIEYKSLESDGWVLYSCYDLKGLHYAEYVKGKSYNNKW